MITEFSLQHLPDAGQRLDAMFQAFGDLLFILDEDGTIRDYKAGDANHLFLPPSQFLGRKMQEVLPYKVGKKYTEALFSLRWDKKVVQIEYSLPTPMGERWYESRLVPLPKRQVVVFVRDMTKYKLSEDKIRNQLDQLAALRSIDLAITSGVDLNQTLAMILDHVRARLNINAASILLLNSENLHLEFAAQVGFTTSALQRTNLKVGQGYAGRAILGHEVLHIPNLKIRRDTDLLRSPFFSRENFVAYYAVPLIAKKQPLGVLEIFHRASLQPDPDWLNFMNMLAGQAAIAIDNAMLFKDLQLTNYELALAYDKTIEGWAHALQLRDRETEEHTRRVAELTQRLAVKVGIPQGDLLHIRRGAILHDIGKVGIPDNVLLKPGPLNEAEWILMRQHPLIAVKMLEPIAFLAPALPIPRSHHEKWDGSGYPDGLSGDDIPVAARIFSMVDVYDALTSDRPYRSAWPQADVLGYMREQSGEHFDPQLLPAFMEMVGNQQRQ
jgi:putative nucleotidyltransferase with HDIG domain